MYVKTESSHGSLGDFPRTLQIMPCPLFSVTPRPPRVSPAPSNLACLVRLFRPLPPFYGSPLSAHCRAFAGISPAWHSPGFPSGCHLLMLSPPSLSLCFIFPQHLPQRKRTVTVYLFSVFLSTLRVRHDWATSLSLFTFMPKSKVLKAFLFNVWII